MNVATRTLAPTVLLSLLFGSIVGFLALTLNLQMGELLASRETANQANQIVGELSHLRASTERRLLSFRFRPDPSHLKDIVSSEIHSARLSDRLFGVLTTSAERDLLRRFLDLEARVQPHVRPTARRLRRPRNERRRAHTRRRSRRTTLA